MLLCGCLGLWSEKGDAGAALSAPDLPSRLRAKCCADATLRSRFASAPRNQNRDRSEPKGEKERITTHVPHCIHSRRSALDAYCHSFLSSKPDLSPESLDESKPQPVGRATNRWADTVCSLHLFTSIISSILRGGILRLTREACLRLVLQYVLYSEDQTDFLCGSALPESRTGNQYTPEPRAGRKTHIHRMENCG